MHLHLSLAGARAGTTKRGIRRGFARSLATSVSLLALGVVIAPASCHAFGYNWIGGVSGDYGDGINWSSSVVPTPTDTISIDVPLGNSSPLIFGTNYAVDQIVVGDNGTGNLDLDAGGTLTSSSTMIGYHAGAMGTVTINGTGSNWSVNGFLEVGELGKGTLEATNGGSILVTGNATIGAVGPQGDGTVSIDGIGSSFVVNGSLAMAQDTNTTANMTVSNQATASAQDVLIGNAAGGTGTMLVSSGGTLSTDSMFIGRFGQGTLTLQSAGSAVNVLNGGTLYIGLSAGSTGTLNIGAAAGNTAVDPGTLTAGLIQFGAGTGKIVFNHDDANYVFGTDIAGNGSISQLSGTTILTGDETGFSGSVSVTGGRLFVNGGMDNGDATVSSGGLLGGNGTIGSIIADSGSTIAPGNSIGTLNVTGNVGFNAGSTYQVEVNNAGQGDKMIATGTVAIGGGNVQVVATNGSYAANTTYTIISAGNLTGTFSGVTANYAFLTPTLSYDPNNVYLNLASNGASLASVAETPNQQAVADAVDSMGSGDVYAAIQTMDAASARAAYDSLSGEVHASTAGALMNNAHYLNDAVFGRLRGTDLDADNPTARQLAAADGLQIETAAGPTTSRALWGQAFGSWAESDGDGNAARIDNNTAGFLVGLDGEVAPGWRLGLASGYSHSDINAPSRQSEAGVDSFHIAAYGGGHVGPVSLRLGAAYSFNAIDSSRDVNLGRVSDHDKAGYDAHTAQVFGEIGYDAKIGKLALEPFAGMSYVNLSTEGFTEHGGAAALKSHSNNQDLPASTIGLRAGGELARIGTAKLSANGMLGWRHAFGDVTPEASFNFASGSDGFTVSGTPIARNALVAQAGLDLAVDNRLAIGLTYDGQVASDARDNAVQGKLSWKF